MKGGYRYITILIVFSLGWLLGSLFVITFVIHGNENLFISTSNTNSNLRGQHQRPKPESNTHKLLKKYVPKLLPIETPLPTLSIEMIKTLPQFSSGSNNDDEEGGRIFMDFPVDDKLFTVDNFKALESILTVFPNALIRILLASSRDAFAHKAGNILSINHFSKYKRKGYNIVVNVVYKLDDKDTLQGGDAYWKKYQEICCSKCDSKCRKGDNISKYHLLTYIRLVKLWKKGGIFSDFSFFFLGSIDSPLVYQGVYINSFCNNKGDWIDDYVDSDKCFTSTLMVFNIEKSPVITCVLKKYDDPQFIFCIESDERMGGANCISNAFNTCFQEEDIVNDFDDGADNILETFGNNADTAEKNILNNRNWTIASNKRAFWLGALAFKSKWTQLPYPAQTIMAAGVSNLKVKKSSNEKNPLCQLQCSRFVNELDISRLPSDSRVDNVSISGINQASCAPNVIIAGFMKSASSFLFSAIASHPQVLPPLVGQQYKETKCYHSYSVKRLSKRARCFPYIEDGESLTSIDGTVLYATDKNVPYLLKQDNPNVKVIFVVRHPVDRLYSFYKFVYRHIYSSMDIHDRGFDQVIDKGIAQFSKFGILRQLVSNKSNDDSIIDQYYSMFDGHASIASLFMHSIVYPPIKHYMNVLGRDNVLVINSDDLDVKNMGKVRNVLLDAYKFLGLCPFQLPDMEPILTSRNTLPIDAEMTQASYYRLNRFFKPFNDLLGQLTNVNYSEWNNRPPSSLLPLNDKNDTIPKWFELEFLEIQNTNINGTKKGSIMSHLLPKIQKPDDISSNTTLGIITMF